MAFGVLGEEFAGGIEVGVLADAGENIEHLPPGRARVLNAVGRDNWKAKLFREIAELLVDPIFAANKMPLDLDVNIFATKRVDQPLDVPIHILMSAVRT
jgi:hypothetical protein